MTDVANLRFDVDSRSVKVANDNLDTMTKKSKVAGAAAGKTANDTKKLGAAARGAAAGVNMLKVALAGMGIALIGAFSIGPVFAFKDAIAEVSTLVDTATFDMQRLEQGAINFSKVYGGDAAAQAQGYYQIISAGASTAAEATTTLDAANKLAVGGVTDITTAADGLTSVLNAYGDKVGGATEVSDALFVGMKAGKTTIGELSGSLGKVAPLAAQVGVGFDELVASVSALTKGGIRTTEAVTGMRAVLAAVSKPSSEAAKMAKELGLEFNAAALESKGLTGFMDELVEKTGGSTDKLAMLFGGVEALIPVMALSGQAGADFNKIMEEMAVKGGATQEAFDKMVNSPGFQAARLWANLKAVVLELAGGLANSLVPAMKFVSDNMDTIVKIGAIIVGSTIPMLIRGFVMTLVPAILGGIRAITVAIAANPIGFLLTALSAAITAAYVFRRELAQVAADLIEPWADTGNAIIGVFAGAYEYVTTIFSSVPTVIGALAIGTANAVIDAIEGMINFTIDGINDMANKANEIIPGLDLGNMENVDFGRITNPFAEEAENAAGRAGAAFDAAFEKDYIGPLVQDMREFAAETDIAAAEVGEVNEALYETGVVAQTASEGVGEMSDEMKGFQNTARSSFSGFFKDIVHGKNLLDSLGNALGRIADKLLDMAANKIFESIFGSILGAASGGGGLFGGFFAEGGRPPLGKTSIVGEDGPELFRPDRPGTIIPNDVAFGGRQANDNVAIEQNITLSPDVQPTVAAQIMQAAPEIANQAADIVEQRQAGRMFS